MEDSKPSHAAIILDGNRRYAKKIALQPWKGHDFGAEKVEKLIEWASELNLKMLTLYTLSTENLKREKQELEHLFELIREWFKKVKTDKRIKEKQVRFRFIGNLSLLPKDIQKLLDEVEQDTENYKGITVNFCIAYGGRQEIIEAIKKLVAGKQEVNEENIRKNLWLSEEPDFIVRTGNVIRTSNFLPWQAAYSEWIFLDKLWPEFTKEDLIQCIKKFGQVKRNFGK